MTSTHDRGRPDGVSRRTADRIRRRDRGRCQQCGTRGREVAYLEGADRDGVDDDELLVTLCRACHERRATRD